jgi:DNA-binding beta-propeller fold protein YncE
MKKIIFALLLTTLGIAWLGLRTLHSTAMSPTAAGTTLKQIAAIDLPGPPGKRFDYLTIDYDDGYLFSAHLGAGLLYVIDLKTNKVVLTIPDVPGVEGVEYVPELKKVYTSDWLEKKIGVIDLRQGKIIAKLPAQQKPDGSAYAAPFHKLYVSDERAQAEIVVDVQTDKIVNTLNFKSQTGMPQYDPVAKLVYINLQEIGWMTVINPATDKVVTPIYSVAPCKGNHGMALDPEHRRAFLVCEDNNLMAVIDLEKHRVVTTLPTADGGDVIKYDPGLKRIYVACYSGAISVFQEDDPDHFRKLEDFPTQHKVHSLAVDERTHRVYVPEEEENGKPVARLIVYEAIGPH